MCSVTSLICPNCDNGVDMESDAFGVHARRAITHTCPACGYAETR